MEGVYSIFPNTSRKNTNKYNESIYTLSKNSRLKYLIELVGCLKYGIPIWAFIEDAVLYSVIGQMLSNSAAKAIIKRLLENFGTSNFVIEWAEKTWRRKGPLYGVSQKKRKALYKWLLFSRKNYELWKRWKDVPLETYRSEICAIWGFGRWSADMIAIFYLGRLDICPETDRGIQKISSLIFKTGKSSVIKKHISGCETVVALYMWELINQNLTVDFKGNTWIT